MRSRKSLVIGKFSSFIHYLTHNAFRYNNPEKDNEKQDAVDFFF